ncbi:uncharacterized protein LOC141853700 [Brevipalpus obovatus]|uniref:uncharacterized protein LOC141853700 n=1 Tax=Brevipalpus obovatus TaxID=246614 RepID=UPI003D9E8455
MFKLFLVLCLAVLASCNTSSSPSPSDEDVLEQILGKRTPANREEIERLANLSTEISNKLTDLIIRAREGPQSALKLAFPADKTLNVIKLALTMALQKDQISYIDPKKIAKALQTLDNSIAEIEDMLKGSNGIQTRGLMGSIVGGAGAVAGAVAGTAFKVVGGTVNTVTGAMSLMWELLVTRRDSIIELMGAAIVQYQQDGLKGLVQVLKPSLQELVNSNQMFKDAVDQFAEKLDLAEDGITLLNQLTGGKYRPINAISMAVRGMDDVANILRDRKRDDDRSLLVTRLVGILIKSKNSKVKRVQNVLSKVCVQLDKVPPKKAE